jgi:subtilisin family serine protease
MKSMKFPLQRGTSISLSFLVRGARIAEERPAARRFGLSAVRSAARARAALAPDVADPSVPVIIQAKDFSPVERALTRAGLAESGRWAPLASGMVSVRATPSVLAPLLALGAERACHTYLKKRKTPHLQRAAVDCRLRASPAGHRVVPQDGTGVVIGIVDTGFDLSHPMFRDASGALRVEALLEQFEDDPPKSYTRAQLERAWAAGRRVGRDEDGHGTHVASIAGGTAHQGLEGIAPGATFILVKTNFVDTDEAVTWIFDRAGRRPCVVNMSLGHHWGAHDGTDAEERLHVELAKKAGRIVCVSAGNERDEAIHVGGRFRTNQTRLVTFDALDADFAVTFWHAKTDRFELALVAPDGSELPFPSRPGQGDRFEGGRAKVELGSQVYTASRLLQHQAQFSFSKRAQRKHMRGWTVRITCRNAASGRIDGWFENGGFATFRDSPLLEEERTIGLAATGDGCIAVASHVTKRSWPTGGGDEEDLEVTIGRTSPFSSMGPTRDGRQKPDVSAPGQYITAALARGSESADDEERADVRRRLLSIEGTSMAAPLVTGVIALLLQKNPRLTVRQARDILRRSARHDAKTGTAAWSPSYGYGKIDVAKALSLA